MAQTITFSNGLRLLLDEMPTAQSCAVNLCILSGLRFETPARCGISHMIEHMLFKGTKSRTARQLAEAADDLGANLNAYTCKEYTCVYIRSLPEHLSKMLELLGDMLHSSKLAPEDLEMEKGVVMEEIAMYEDLPEELAFDIFYDMVWPGHMLGKNILGTRKTVEDLTSADLRGHMNSFYTPARMVLSICGKLNAAELRAQVEGLFGGTPQGAGAAAPELPMASFTPQLRFTPKHVEQNQMILAFPGCALDDPQRYRAALLCTMLGGSTSSRLFQRLREELGLVYSVDFFNVHHRQEGISGVTLGLNAKTQCKALEEVLRVLRAFPEQVTAPELKRAQEQAAAGLVMSLESNAARASRAASNTLLLGEDIPVAQSLANYRAVTLEEMRGFAKELLDMRQVALCVLGKYSHHAERCMKELLA
jgi:predicted Zn-dependent peptidase